MFNKVFDRRNQINTLILAVLVTLVISLFSSIDAATSADVQISSGVPILIDAGQDRAIQRAVKDLQRDLQTVFGQESPIVTSASDLGDRDAIVITRNGSQTADSTLVGMEAHSIIVKKAGSAARIVLQGTDTRGTIYAIYTFSERFLEVPPLWFWASWKPQQKTEITVPRSTNLRFGSPHVAWRAWFPNNKDLLRGWQKTNPTIDADDVIFETMLRLKLNVINVGEDIGDYPSPQAGLKRARQACDRGLAITTPYLGSFRYWDKYWQLVRQQEPPKLALANREKFDEFWTYHINLLLREKFEMVWGIGFRGAKDQAFYDAMPDAPQEDASRARVIQEMILRQITLLKRITNQAHPVMQTMLYAENSKLFAQQLLRLPEEPSLIWTFSSDNRDHFPGVELRGAIAPPNQPIGYYMNFQFTSSGAHLAQAESPWKMEQNFRIAQSASPQPLQFSTVNVGNVREFVLTIAANAQMMWNFTEYKSDVFVKQFCDRYFGARHANQIASLYKDFFASYWQQKQGDIPGFSQQYLFHDLRISHASEALLKHIQTGQLKANPLSDRPDFYRIEPANGQTQVDAIIQGTDGSIKKLRSVLSNCDALNKTLDPQGQTFFNDNLCVQSDFMQQANRLLNSLAHAFKSLPNQRKTIRYLAQAKQAARAMPRTLKAAERDRFAGWYVNEQIFGVKKLNDAIDRAAIALSATR
ncbi:glycosyl hydrolase 115 family protein [Phormidesmis sp. 146-35]